MYDHVHALGSELRSSVDPSRALHHSTTSVLKGHLKNASRQYKKAVVRFGFALTLSKLAKDYFFLIFVDPIDF